MWSVLVFVDVGIPVFADFFVHGSSFNHGLPSLPTVLVRVQYILLGLPTATITSTRTACIACGVSCTLRTVLHHGNHQYYLLLVPVLLPLRTRTAAGRVHCTSTYQYRIEGSREKYRECMRRAAGCSAGPGRLTDST